MDYISLSDGAGYEESGHLITDMDRSKHIPEHGEAFKKALKIPVFVASQHDPVKIDKNIADGKYDIQAMGRQLFCRPRIRQQARGGKAKGHRPVHALQHLSHALPCRPDPGLPRQPEASGREYAMDEYRIGPWQKDESRSCLKACCAYPCRHSTGRGGRRRLPS